ncbi:gamma-butyrobetaine hydroxylase-like domain-containing protein [Shewanella sp. 4_MG-2023]|uniref:gamma-butyrobetaine hydroxylase-like domain-containing protein n=1 Tax=Shewanella sp. 4_MG-2023 TaxID=3062652 RepID=UPI0026E44EC1|nr:gamma-butyrobetaine hydroxylase-like domain-containing protein [Shewanella sp. 4_MG-2023]MDO6678669.1 gamma-butyrobetaine hydroxylase-like domain-containing protein [Shewanella sp. 4_MG-2023]
MSQQDKSPVVTNLKLKRKSKLLEVSFESGEVFNISCEMLRVHSPSAEVQRHGNPILVTHKKAVNITGIEPVGNYAVKITFDDGHDTGLFSWKILFELGNQQVEIWERYLARLRAEKGSREPLIDMNIKYS